MDIIKYITNQFIKQVGYVPNITTPKTFNEKIQWLKLFYHDPLMTQCADKFAVRDYVKSLLGEEYLIPLLGVYDSFEEIGYDILPSSFVFKLNNGSGEVFICKNKDSLDKKRFENEIKNWLSPEKNHYLYSYEWCYKNIAPKIVCEEYLNSDDLIDYKFLCFDGEPRLVFTCSERSSELKVDFYDLDWKKLSIKRHYKNSVKGIEKPEKLEEMLDVCRILSKRFPFVRVDLFQHKNRVFFGELTFYPGNGMESFQPLQWDYNLGKCFKFPSAGPVSVEGKQCIIAHNHHRPLNILFFSHTSGLDGAGRSLADLVNGFVSQGVICNVILPSPGALKDKLEASDCGVLIAPQMLANTWHWASFQDSEVSWRLTEQLNQVVQGFLIEIRNFQPDYIISQTIVSPWGAIFAELLSVPHALSVREYGILDHNLTFKYGFQETLEAFYQTSDLLFSVSHDVINVLFDGDPEHKCQVIYSGIEVDQITNPKGSNCDINQFFPNLDGAVVGLIGNYHPGKGQLDLVKAVINLLEKGIALRCVLVGRVIDRDYMEEINALITNSGYKDNFACLEFTPNIYSLMKEIDCIVSCSKNEALGRTLIEASLLEIPIVYSNMGGSKEIFIPNVHGLAYEPGNCQQLAECVLRVLEEPDSAIQRAKAASTLCKKQFNIISYSNRGLEKIRFNLAKNKGRASSVKSVIELITEKGKSFFFTPLFNPRLYWKDTEKYFSEEKVIYPEPIQLGFFECKIELNTNCCTSFRFDPVENEFISIEAFSVDAFDVDGSLLEPQEAEITFNGAAANRQWIFYNIDPQININFTRPIKSLLISGYISIISKEDILSQIANLNNSLTESNKLISSLNEEIKSLNQDINSLNQAVLNEIQEKEQILASTSWQITKPLRQFKTMVSILKKPRPIGGRVFNVAKVIFRLMPLSRSTKDRLRFWAIARSGIFAGYLPSIIDSNESVNKIEGNADYVQFKHKLANLLTLKQSEWTPSREKLLQFKDKDLQKIASSISFGPNVKPKVSIIIPVYGNASLTLECLASIQYSTVETSYEIVVADDASFDATAELLGLIKGIKIHRNSENQGFLRNCNSALPLAVGDFVVYLNNDVQVTDGWLDGLLEVFSAHPNAGAVGPMIVYPSGHLQEAGVSLRKDATADMVGLNDNPYAARFEYTRPVDYCSGACLIIRGDLIRKLGGFSDELAPAYCEDADLCLRIIEQGYKVYYTHRSKVIHHLSKTTAADGISKKLYQVSTNLIKLHNKWAQKLDELASVKVIAFYLPQFHRIPENDVWWGDGFTEWTNVTKAKPNFVGHYQPRVPADLGYYDLNDEDVMIDQAALARKYGIDGFCFYYYWFGGKRLLEMPVERMLQTGKPDFPYCLCWANENWSRRWDGRDSEILIGQQHSPEDDRAVILDLIRHFRSPNYIRIDGRPHLIVYRVDLFPDFFATSKLWREVCREQGIGDIYISMVESHDLVHKGIHPSIFGCDAAIEFPPLNMAGQIAPSGEIINPDFHGGIGDYRDTALRYCTRDLPAYTRFRGVMPGWDNTARRQNNGFCFEHSSPDVFQAWMEHVIQQTRAQHHGDERIIFINAWNEWAEGAYLEPDTLHGHSFLEAVRNAKDAEKLLSVGN